MLKWLDNAVFYQIYPTSFYDSNGDGIGDLNGIIEKVDYVKSLGVSAVWLNPIFKSPFKDGGYDIEDYYSIDKKFGTMKDLERLIKVYHENNIKIILDLVIGHTSLKCKWFVESAKPERNAYSDYYIWTNSVFENYDNMIIGLFDRDGGYMKNYYASQPALNFGFNKIDDAHPWMIKYDDERLKPLREEILNIMRFYLKKGVDGFRVDMASSLVKNGKKFNEKKPYDDSNKGLEGITWLWHKILGTLREEFQDKVYIAEWVNPQNSIGKCGFDMDFLTHDTFAYDELFRNEPKTNLTPYYENGNNYFSERGKGTLKHFVKYINYLYDRMGDNGCFSVPTGVHDEIRMPTFKSHDLIKTIFAFILTVKNIPFIYYGDEIGIEHTFGISKDGGGIRTGARTPMLWNGTKNKGFSENSDTYLPLFDKKGVSVKEQDKDKNSLLNTVRKLIEIKENNSCFNVSSEQKFIKKGYPCIFTRSDDKQTATIYINPSNKTYKIKDVEGNMIISNNATYSGNKLTLLKQSFAIIIK